MNVNLTVDYDPIDGWLVSILDDTGWPEWQNDGHDLPSLLAEAASEIGKRKE